MMTRTAEDKVFPLILATPGEQVRIVSLKVGKGFTRRLSNLGLPLNTEVQVIFRNARSGVVVACHSQRIALGAGMAGQVMVALTEKPLS